MTSRHRILPLAAAALAAALLCLPAAAQAKLTTFPFLAAEATDDGFVFGRTQNEYGNPQQYVRWNATTGQQSFERTSPAGMDGFGGDRYALGGAFAYGWPPNGFGDGPYTVFRWDAIRTASPVTPTQVRTLPERSRMYAVTGLGRVVWGHRTTSFGTETKDLVVDDTTLIETGATGLGQGMDFVATADDGAFVTTDDQTAHTQYARYYSPTLTPTELPADLIPFAVASKGWVLAHTAGAGRTWHAIQLVNGSWKRHDLPPLLDTSASQVGMPYRISSGGKVVVRAGTPSIHQWKPGATAWEDIGAQVNPVPAQSTSKIQLADVNAWGDILVYTPTVEDGDVDHSALLANRTVLTGQVQPTGPASGGGRAASLKGKLVTLGDGSVTLTAALDVKGKFSLDVPAGDAWTLSAPAGTCLVAGNGCHAVAKLAPVVEGAKPIVLAKTAVPNLATFVAKPKSSLKVANGKVSTVVKCNATANPCVATVTLRSGTKVYGTGKVTVPKGTSKAIVIALSAAAKAYLMNKPTAAVGATLVATSTGAPKLTTIQAFTLKR